jgi:hypothetical protein
MSCGPSPQTFRLLDAYVGWDVGDDAEFYKNLSGLQEIEGVRLAARFPGTIDPAVVLQYLPPPQLARGCDSCEWYLVTPAPPASRLLRRVGCSGDWFQVWPKRSCPSGSLLKAVAIAVHRHYVAIADREDASVRIWTRDGERLIATIPIKHIGPIAFTNSGELLVTRRGRTQFAALVLMVTTAAI